MVSICLALTSHRLPRFQHCAGVNSLLVSKDGTHVWTASRDSLIKRYVIYTSGMLAHNYQPLGCVALLSFHAIIWSPPSLMQMESLIPRPAHS